MIPAAFYRPDMAETNAGVSAKVVNVNPRRDGNGISYHPHNSLRPIGEALSVPPRGAYSTVTRSGLFHGFIGTDDALHMLQSDYSFAEIGSDYSLPTGHDWGMVQYGDRLLMTNTEDGMLQYDIEAGGSVTAVPGAPKARSLFTAFECVFALDCDGNNYLMRNSAIGNYANWKSGGAGAQEFADGEALMGGGALNDGTAAVLQRAAVHILTVSGNANVYGKRKVAEGIGAVSPRSIVTTPGAIYFLDVGGFYRLTTAGLESIGQGKVNETFLERVNQSALATVEGAYDQKRKQVGWRYQADGNGSETVFDNIIIFDIDTSEWVELEERTSAMMRMAIPAMALEDLDAKFGSLEDIPYSLDSDVWKGDRPRLAALDEDFRLGFFDGPSLPAVIETATVLNPREVRINSAVPITDAADVTIHLGLRQRLADAAVWRPTGPLQASGRIPMSGKGRAISMRVMIPAGSTWSFFRGLDGLDVREVAGR
jgi:hypothetical protein